MPYQSRTPQITLKLDPFGNLVAELPGPNGSRRNSEPITSIDTIRTILAARLRTNHTTIGLDGDPMIGQIRHWERHLNQSPPTIDPECIWCIAAEMGIDTSEAAFRRAKRDLYKARSRARTSIPYTTAGDGSVRIRRIPTKSRPKHLPQPSRTRRVPIDTSALFDPEDC